MFQFVSLFRRLTYRLLSWNFDLFYREIYAARHKPSQKQRLYRHYLISLGCFIIGLRFSLIWYCREWFDWAEWDHLAFVIYRSNLFNQHSIKCYLLLVGFAIYLSHWHVAAVDSVNWSLIHTLVVVNFDDFQTTNRRILQKYSAFSEQYAEPWQLFKLHLQVMLRILGGRIDCSRVYFTHQLLHYGQISTEERVRLLGYILLIGFFHLTIMMSWIGVVSIGSVYCHFLLWKNKRSFLTQIVFQVDIFLAAMIVYNVLKLFGVFLFMFMIISITFERIYRELARRIKREGHHSLNRLAQLHRDLTRVTKNLLDSSRDRYLGRMLMVFITINIPINVSLFIIIALYPLPPFELLLLSGAVMMQGASLLLAFWPLAQLGEATRRPGQLIPFLQNKLTQVITLKLKYQVSYESIHSTQPLGYKISVGKVITKKAFCEVRLVLN